MSASSKEIRVKVLFRSDLNGEACLGWNNQCPDNKPEWGPCRFLFDPFERTYDWLVVVHDLPHSRTPTSRNLMDVYTLSCPTSHTLLVTTEPGTITQYGKHFVRQFAHVITTQNEADLPHPHAIRSQTGNVWYYGKTYDEAAAMPPCDKTKMISTVCSSKRQGHTLHAKRFEFTHRLAQAHPELDIFGHGTRFIDHKFDALDPYAFHLIIENYYAPHHWTEKLADAFLGYTVPFYYGCPNVFDYFPRESVIPIDIHDFDGSLKVIKQALTYENYRKRLPAVQEARRLVLDHYNLPALLCRTILALDNADSSNAPSLKRLYNRKDMLARNPVDFVSFASWRLRNYFQGLLVNGGKRE